MTQNYGTKSNKLYSVDFSSGLLPGEQYERVIDGDFTVTTPDDLTEWFADTYNSVEIPTRALTEKLHTE